MISILIIECLEAHLELHLIFIGIQMNFGGIGQLITLLTMDSITGTILDSADGITLDGIATMIGTMAIHGTTGAGEIE